MMRLSVRTSSSTTSIRRGVLRLLTAVLAPDGVVVLSIPNFAFICTRITLALRRMEYSKAGGAFDAGHLRFFNLTTARISLQSAGLRICRERPIPWVLRGERLGRIRGLRVVAGAVNGPPQDLAARVYPRLLNVGIVIVADLPRRAPFTSAWDWPCSLGVPDSADGPNVGRREPPPRTCTKPVSRRQLPTPLDLSRLSDAGATPPIVASSGNAVRSPRLSASRTRWRQEKPCPVATSDC